MSDEIKDTNTAPETGQEETAGTSRETKGKAQSKPRSEPKPKADTATGALKAAGLAACGRHRLTQVWMTSDGQAFPQESDAIAHARNIHDKAILKVTPK